MQKIYFFVQLALCFCCILPNKSKAQNCTSLTATFNTYESRCAATGSISVHATGGSGSYKYKTTGPVNTNFTTSDSITGLSAGTYSVIINDITTNCTFTQTNVVVQGSYLDPRFTLQGVDVSCDNGNNGSITVNGVQFGRSPFTYSIMAPSPMGVGTSNNTGIFPNLIGGDYSIQMTDSCGGIQTRSIKVNNYTWWIDSYSFNKLSCDSASGFIKVIDSRGNVSTVGPLPGFMYGVVRYPGDTIWSSNSAFTFYLNGAASIDIIAKDGCGIIKKATTTLKFNPSVGASVTISNKTCNSFTASLTSLVNFFNADYCLYDNNNVQIGCNGTGVFSNIPYGSYCIKAHSLCPDTIITRCFTVSPPPLSVGNSVNIYNKNCTTFSAAITGQVGLTMPSYCLYDSAGTQISCNSNGIFNSLAYGRYCITTDDSCRDTIITRCFNILRPRPVVPATITPSYINCRNVTITVGGDSLYSPLYCLYDTAGVLIECNSTGIFDSLTVGNHCVTVYDACYDTTITRCFTVGAATVTNDLTANITNKTCSTFTVTASSNHLTGEQYCLYTQTDSLIGCNSTGIFSNIPYGTYCIKARDGCPDTLFQYCFTASAPKPSATSTVTISNNTCTSFTAKITGQQNLTNPQYCIYDSNNVQLSCNTTGTFNNLAYGSYCIQIINTCYDTTIIRCFSSYPKVLDISVGTTKSCTYGYATISVSVTGGVLPVNIKLYKPDSTLFFDRNYNSTSINIDSIPGIVPGETYKIVATDNCGIADSAITGVTASIATHTASVIAQCPSAAWQNGSGKIQLSTNTNMGVFTVRIIKKNGTTLSPELSPNTASGGVFTFNDLGTGTYIVRYKLNDICNKYLYDTVTIAPYYYPNLSRSSAYQCDVSGFSIGAVASNGVGPFSYEIIGSTPSFPSINTTPQSSPVFSIDNGTNYSLIRLRVLDACGNATLGDASILPLANYKIDVDSNCFQSSSSLSVDTIFNSTYAWFKKENYNSVDSTYLGSGYKVYIPYLSANDTGTYVCHVIVNTGCVKRTYVYNLNGLCYMVLPVKMLSFSGKFINDKGVLNWKPGSEKDLQKYIIERKSNDGKYVEIGWVNPIVNSSGAPAYDFIDISPGTGKIFYRLKLLYQDHTFTYSKTIMLEKHKSKWTLQCYPNPVSDMLTINLVGASRHVYKITLLNMVGQGVWETTFILGSNNTLRVARSHSMAKGIYTLRCIDMNTNEEISEKVIVL